MLPIGFFICFLVFFINQICFDVKHIVCFRCVGRECRVAAYDLLVELADGCAENLVYIVAQLISLHHIGDPGTLKEWEVQDNVHCIH